MDTTDYIIVGGAAYLALSTLATFLYLVSYRRRRSDQRRLLELEGADQRASLAETRVADLNVRYSGLIDLDDEKERLRAQIAADGLALQEAKIEVASAKSIYDRLRYEIGGLEAVSELAEVGIRTLSFELDSHAAYVAAIKSNQDDQKRMVSDKTAVLGDRSWTVNGKESEGKKMVDRSVRLSLRAFNNECDALMARITWKNLPQISDRIRKSAEAIDKLNSSLNVTVAGPYIALKLREAKLRQEEALKKQEEKDELRRQAEEEREEAKAQREYQAEIRKREKEERDRVTALAAAMEALTLADDEEAIALKARIASLETQLSEAQAASLRVQSMAELTRAGYVYVISNGGSFGPQMFKVGMTRRLAPLDRVKELGDASVPFPFDVHALVYTDNAPRLERELHEALSAHRVNRVNFRKEFFRAEMDVVRTVVHSRFPGIPFDEAAESQEYAMTKALQGKLTPKCHIDIVSDKGLFRK